MEAKIIQVPGIPGNLQEMSLDQYMAALPADHYARKQLDEIRAQALKAVEISTQLMQANEKIMDLQNKLILGIPAQSLVPLPYATSTIAPAPNMYIGAAPNPAQALPIQNPKRGPWPKLPCPHCGIPIITSGGGWAAHQRAKHPDNPAPRPTL